MRDSCVFLSPSAGQRFPGHAVRASQMFKTSTRLVLAVALIGVAAPSTAVAQTPHNTTIVLRSDVPQRAIALEATRLARSTPIADFNILVLQPQAPQPRGWAKRHPVLLGTLVGLGVGYGAGWAMGDGRIADWSNDMNSWVFGAVGAGVGAIVGRLVE